MEFILVAILSLAALAAVVVLIGLDVAGTICLAGRRGLTAVLLATPVALMGVPWLLVTAETPWYILWPGLIALAVYCLLALYIYIRGNINPTRVKWPREGVPKEEKKGEAALYLALLGAAVHIWYLLAFGVFLLTYGRMMLGVISVSLGFLLLCAVFPIAFLVLAILFFPVTAVLAATMAVLWGLFWIALCAVLTLYLAEVILGVNAVVRLCRCGTMSRKQAVGYGILQLVPVAGAVVLLLTRNRLLEQRAGRPGKEHMERAAFPEQDGAEQDGEEKQEREAEPHATGFGEAEPQLPEI